MTYMNYSRYGENPEPEWDRNTTILNYDFWFIIDDYQIYGDMTTYRRTGGADLTANLSMYSIDIRPTQRGWYDVYTLVCEVDGVPCLVQDDFVQALVSP